MPVTSDEVIRHATEITAGESYRRLADFVDRFGARICGSRQLDEAIDWTVEALKADGLDVSVEEFEMPGWRRGFEEAKLLSPIQKRMSICGLGNCAPTPPEGLEADCLVVATFEELSLRADEAKGRIVVFNQAFVDYDSARRYRNQGPAAAAAVGASAALVRSVTPFSLNTPHAGVTFFDAAPAIPAACVTVEDAEMLDRMLKRGRSVRVSLRIESGPCQPLKSRNVVADLVGVDWPEQLVVVCAHVDSWDVGVGAMDDGGGVFAAWQAVRTLQALKVRPRRTIRLILFSGEELGLWGGRRYFQRHRSELANRISFMLESDGGTFQPLGVTCSGDEPTARALRTAMKPLDSIGASLVQQRLDGPDIVEWASAGVPVGNLVTTRPGQPDDFYFYFHHTEADTMSVQDSDEMDKCVAVFAVVAMELANSPELLPR